MQIIMVHVEPPDEADDPNAHYVPILKHVYLYKNKISSNICVQLCRGVCHRFDWGNNFRVGLLAANYMLDQVGGFQVRFSAIQAKVPKRNTQDAIAREQGYKFIREKGPRSNNRNQFMGGRTKRFTPKAVPSTGGKKGKVVMALQNYMRGRQNAKTLEYWPFTLKSFKPWFFNEVLRYILGSLRQNAITWIGKTRTGKSLGSKTILFTQSRFEIKQDERDDLVPSIVTAKHLDFFKAEPLTKYKPGVFDDGQLQKKDASFLKAFLNPAETLFA